MPSETTKSSAARVAGREEDEDQEQREQRTELRDRARAQVAVAARLRHVPVDHAANTENDQRQKQAHTGPQVDSLGDDRRDERHEADRHRDAVPHERVVVGAQVIPRGAEGRQRDADEKCEAGPAFAASRRKRLPRSAVSRSVKPMPASPTKRNGAFEMTLRQFAMPRSVRLSAKLWYASLCGIAGKRNTTNDSDANRSQQNPQATIHRVTGLRERSESRMERRSEDICSIGAG